MQHTVPNRLDRRAQTCTECRRRKQKCKPNANPAGGPCYNCTRRYPPVQCINEPYFPNDSTPSRRTSNQNQGFKNWRTKESHKIIVVSRRVSTYRGFDEGPKQFGGALADINTANIVPVDPTPQNSELFYFYIKRLSPLMASLDGQNTPPIHQKQILPLLMQSPLLPKIGILEAAGFQEIFRKQNATELRRMIVLKGEILSHINSFVTQGFNKTCQEAIQSVLHVALLEYYWGDFTSLLVHINGLKGMVRLLGGMTALHNPFVPQLIILLDYEIACWHEQELCMLKPSESSSISGSNNSPQSCDNPLYSLGSFFPAILKPLGISSTVIAILDDIRRLTSLTVGSSVYKHDPELLTQNQVSEIVCRNAAFIQKKILQLSSIPISPTSPVENLISEIIRITAFVYTTAIASRTSISSVYTQPLRQQMDVLIYKVSLSVWKKIPGIFLWILLVASPGSKADAFGRLLRINETLTAMYIGLQDFGFLIDSLRAFWKVQRWIADRLTSDEEFEIKKDS